jgi:PTH1 family peptidyl-tRNA hydrolase
METASHPPKTRPILIVGLGNPGKLYIHNRHNVGFQVIDALAHTISATWQDKPAWCGEVAQVGSGVYLLKPTTFMNDSGRAVQSVMSYFDIPAEHVFLIYDDRDLPFGTTRLTKGFRTGARHNGVKSVAHHIGRNFQRYRFGVGNELMRHRAMHDFVLDDFSALEKTRLKHYIEAAVQTLRSDLQL